MTTMEVIEAEDVVTPRFTDVYILLVRYYDEWRAVGCAPSVEKVQEYFKYSTDRDHSIIHAWKIVRVRNLPVPHEKEVV